ncbi:hypothetical protein [Leeuwenhoekiella sp. H156]|uniref:hypothetical protein n=1 Tax=Leeuwenhoekiella sp. H156 TaxID=3450128 RepID=UPI003FA41E22
MRKIGSNAFIALVVNRLLKRQPELPNTPKEKKARFIRALAVRLSTGVRFFFASVGKRPQMTIRKVGVDQSVYWLEEIKTQSGKGNQV